MSREELTARAIAEYTRRQEMMASIEGGELMDYGFVRVDRLHLHDPASPQENKWRVIKPAWESLGMMGTHNGLVVVVTENGKVWTGLMPHFSDEGVEGLNYIKHRAWSNLLRKLCPKSGDTDAGGCPAFVVYNSSANLFLPEEILQRMQNPHWEAPVWPNDM
jgi:hypothetical protein